ncbi:MAG: hypothetical protein KDK70_43480, partial [Myxococcales bacterium]|nr:hypothetical protein [Myxococcales bacterium]
MEHKPPLDPILYIRLPRAGVRSILGLTRVLLPRVPQDAGPAVLVAAQDVLVAHDALEERWRAKQQPPLPTLDPRPVDIHVDYTWAVLESSLGRYTVFEPDDPDRLRAAEIYGLLFPTGLSF